MTLSHKIDFLGIIVAEKCNPNGDPLNGNIPRVDSEGHGEMSPECLKRKIRDSLLNMGEEIFVQARWNRYDDFKGLKDRFENFKKESKRNDIDIAACEKWIDIRAFGQIIPYKGRETISVRGPVSITFARTLDTVTIRDIRITKSTNLETLEEGEKDPSTMGRRYIIEKGAYVFKGGIHTQLAEKTGFTDEDAEKIKQAILNMFDGDATAARPNGSMGLAKLYWWVHPGKQGYVHPLRVFQSVHIEPQKEYPYFSDSLSPIEGLEPEIYCEI